MSNEAFLKVLAMLAAMNLISWAIIYVILRYFG